MANEDASRADEPRKTPRVAARLCIELQWLPMSAAAARRSVNLMRELARTTRGAHRRRPIYYLVVACAEAAGEDVVLWHWDRDLSAICDFAGIPHESEHDRARAAGLGAEPGTLPA